MKIQNLLYYTLIIFLSGCTQYHQAESMSDRLPLIYPDYTDVTFPINIAPPNFRIQERLSRQNQDAKRKIMTFLFRMTNQQSVYRKASGRYCWRKLPAKKYMSELLLSSMANGYVILIFRIVYPFMRQILFQRTVCFIPDMNFGMKWEFINVT